MSKCIDPYIYSFLKKTTTTEYCEQTQPFWILQTLSDSWCIHTIVGMSQVHWFWFLINQEMVTGCIVAYCLLSALWLGQETLTFGHWLLEAWTVGETSWYRWSLVAWQQWYPYKYAFLPINPVCIYTFSKWVTMVVLNTVCFVFTCLYAACSYF